MSITIEQLGFTQEELQQRVIDQMCRQLLTQAGYDEDGNETTHQTTLDRSLRELVRKQIDETINALAEKHVLPNVTNFIETLTLQETNKWGEKTATPVTFIEYLTKRAEAYMQEMVNYEGKGKKENDYGSWSGTQTRITYLVHQHLHYSIDTAMKQAMKEANSAIAKGIQETVKLKLAEVSAAIEVGVKMPR